ncbi:MAG: pentapeptide repeat-containing protein [Actinomycetota bacterium]|nr:pentapeptide repeat-containing protein [Actinomycetota bacterium]
MKARLAHLALVTLVLVTACSGSSGDGAMSTGAPNGTDPDGFVAVDVPAGVNWASSSLPPSANPSPAVPSFEQVTATAGVPPAPAGFPFRQSDYISQLFVLGDVQLATGSCGCWQGGDSTGVFGGLRAPVYLFRSVDAGATWAQVDLSAVLGDVNGRVSSVVEHDGAMILTATTSDAAGVAPTVIDVLRSTDGAAWQRLSRIVSDAAIAVPVHAFDLHSLGSSLVLYGADQACEFDGSSAIQNIGPAYQSRIWTSTDGGVSWLARSAAETGLDIGRLPLPDAAACAGLGIQDVLDTYASTPRLVSRRGDRLFVWSSDGQQIVSTADGVDWSKGALDGTLALPSEATPAPEINSAAAGIFSLDGQYVALSLENGRMFDEAATSGSGLSVIVWTSRDGATWQRQPLGRPLVNSDYSATYQFFETAGHLALRAFNRQSGEEFGMYESVAGVSEDWTKCVAAAGVNCAFSSEVSAFGPGADLSGIDLSFTSLEGRDLTDVSFAGGRLRGVNMIDVTLLRTNFDGAELSTVTLLGDLTTSTFDGATLENVTFDDWFFTTELLGATIIRPTIRIADGGLPVGVSLAGRDLSGYSFTGGSLNGVDFTGSNLSRSSFTHTDLNGAVFAGATLDSIFFFEVTCPDGQPASDDVFGPERCRL